MRGASSMIPAVTATAANDQPTAGHCIAPSASNAETSALELACGVPPSAAGTCCRKITTAMPSVKPSITGHGM